MSIKRCLAFSFMGLLAASGIAYAVVASMTKPVSAFVTWDSLEPDKWSSIWLIKTYIDPDAVVVVHSPGDPLGEGIPFGVPDATYKRSGNQSTFESLLTGFNQQDPVLQRLGNIITAIETTRWNTANDPVVSAVEHNFRRLQDRYGRTYVPSSCYGHFFDVLYNHLSADHSAETLHQSLSRAVDNQACNESPAMAERKRANRVAELPIDRLLSEIATNKHVVFVDTREPAEFAKNHIPGAINLPMRDLNPAIYNQLKKADRVISYCIKDFRGYEAARQMLDNGIINVAVMKPHGLSGWQSLGLPVVSEVLSEATATTQLTHCARNPSLCTLL